MAPKRTPEGTWQIRWRDASGRQHKKRFKRQEDARNAEIEILARVQAGTFINPRSGKVTLRSWADTVLTGAHNLRPKTITIVHQSLDHILPVLGDYTLTALVDDVEAIDTYLAGRLASGAAPSTVHREYRTLKRLLKVAVERQRIPRSPMALVAEPRVPVEEMTFLTADQLMTLAASVDLTSRGRNQPYLPGPERYRTLVLVAGWGGPRWGELAALEIARIDKVARRIQIVEQADNTGARSEPKSRYGRRWVALPPLVMDELVEHCKGRRSGLVWTSPQGGPLSHTRFTNRVWYPACQRAGLGTLTVERTYKPGRRPGSKVIASTSRRYTGLRFHDLRHTSVALAIKAGAHPKAIQRRLGHSKISVTLDLYGHLYPDMDDDLAIALNDIVAASKPTLGVVGS